MQGSARQARLAPEAVERGLERFRQTVQERSLKMTTVREQITRAVLEHPGHFDIEELVQVLRDKQVAGAHAATVYRTMPLLVDAGLVQPTLLSSSGDRQKYEVVFERDHHDHMICIECGKVVEFYFEAMEVLQRDLAAHYGFELTGHFHELLGRCPQCRKKKTSSKRGEAKRPGKRAAKPSGAKRDASSVESLAESSG